jgi:hypothetical protein
MKMDFLFGGFFWGIVLVLLGVSMILKVVFHLDIPVFRLVVAGVLIFLGVRLLLGMSHGGAGAPRNTVLFGEGDLGSAPADREYSVVFGKGILDLKGLDPATRTEALEFVTVFGEGTLRVDPAVPTKVTMTAAFGGARAPDGAQTAFGTYVYRTPGLREDAPFLDVRATVVFGSLAVEAP